MFFTVSDSNATSSSTSNICSSELLSLTYVRAAGGGSEFRRFRGAGWAGRADAAQLDSRAGCRAVCAEGEVTGRTRPRLSYEHPPWSPPLCMCAG